MMGADMGVGAEQVGRAAEKAELDAILRSKIFRRAPNLSKIIAYTCEKYFEGDAASIKEYNIAVEALGRSPDFDPTRDSIVRVEYTRLRRRLRQYYLTEGASSTVELQIPETGYAPRFVARNPQKPDNAGSEQPNEAQVRSSGEALPAEARPQQPRGRKRWLAIPLSRSTKRTLVAAATIVGVIASIVVGRHLIDPEDRLEAADSTSPESGSSSGAAPGTHEGLRIAAGSQAPQYVDASGRLWLGDRWFEGGHAIERKENRILRTLDQTLYQTARVGRFQYHIPLRPGIYQLHLHFAETALGLVDPESSGEGLRRFDVIVNGRTVLSNFDVLADSSGPNIANEKVFIDITPSNDGFLHLSFNPQIREAILSGIEIIPGIRGKMLPVRILTGARVHYDSKKQFWGADRYFRGGRIIRRFAPVPHAEEPGLHLAERWGHFDYAIPVAPGSYTVKLIFSESYFGQPRTQKSESGGGAGSRLFDVYCNGVALLRNFDIYREAGGPNRAVEKVFRGIRPNAQNKIALSFVPVRDYPCLKAIEVTPE